MQKRIVLCCFLWLLFVLPATTIIAQNYPDTKEKIYIQCSHMFFKPGETIYFKAYVVKGKDNTPSFTSNVLYTEMLSPAGTVVQKMSLPVKDGYAEGSFSFADEAPGGLYKIKAYTSWMQNETESRFFFKELTLQKVIAPRILLKLDFPEKGYGPGSEVHADFSMRSLDDRPISSFGCKYTVSIGGKEISNGTFKTDGGGKATVLFQLPADLHVNDGLLNITVLYGSYTESISRSIPIVLNKIDLQFMPEGGTLVNNLRSVIAFKAMNEFGKATDIKGVIKDEKGNTVTSFESYHMGMGRFELTPRGAHTYKAVITSPAGINEEYALPVADNSGLVMQMSKGRKKVELMISSTTATDIKIQASSHGVIYYLQKNSLHAGDNYFSMDETLFPAGITQFTIYDCDDQPLAERLFFLNEDRKLDVQVSTDKTTYGPREKVKLKIVTKDETGKPVPSGFSLAVMDDKLWTFADDKQDHIQSWLLLGSELKGKVEEPQFYFKKEEAKAIPSLDLLMLTQGYRYFDYTEYVLKQNSLQYLPDQENVLSGRIVNSKGEPVNAKVYLINTVMNGKGMEITTTPEGYFFFTGLQPNSYYSVFAQSLNKKESVRINILQNGIGHNPGGAASYRPEFAAPLDKKWIFPVEPVNPEAPVLLVNNDKNKKEAGRAERDILAMDGLENRKVAMAEVVVVGAGMNRRSKEIGYAVTTIRADDIAAFGNLNNALAGKVAGLQIVNDVNAKNGNAGEARIQLRGIRSITGNGDPLFVLDGVPIPNLNAINPNDVQNVTVLRDAAASTLFGSAAANGAILIETKKFRKDGISFDVSAKYYYCSQQVTTTGSNYTPVKKFYAPAYSTTYTEERTDFRETIYWNPVVQTGKDGTAELEFYNSDATTTFRVIAEGIGFNGQIGRAETTYAVQNMLQVDAKIPPYLTVGDKAKIPVVIKNNSEEEQSFNLEVIPPANVTTGQYDKIVVLPAKSSQEVLVSLEAVAATEGIIQFIVSGPGSKEKISLPFEAADKGFPVKLVFSGNTASQNDFTISKMVPGTLKANLKLYKTLEGQLLDGIESMLHEPYGCFEQTSSSTYPNVFILKYLRESGKSNPVIEKKALDYIERGYQRLVGFETAQNGFEWFGHTPAHEALTAYGLLEFTDMQEFVSVDKKMLERTKKFLLDRRDGNGGFKLASGGYDRFASVPNKIANIYIVYALTQSGIGHEIQKEYEAAIKQAMQSKDGYQLAMMAIASISMKDQASYDKLMGELALLKEKQFLNAETSVVNSRDASLRVETNALYAIALLRSSTPDMAKAADLISKILGEKSYYGYGSTQATVLALQAIVEYSKAAGKNAKDAQVYFTLNGNKIADYNTVLSKLKEGDNNFVVDYEKTNHAVPYNFEVSYSTFTPPTSAKAELNMDITLDKTEARAGETVRMDIAVTNTKAGLQPMAIAKIGIPAGLSAQPWQLKEIMEKNKAAYYEIFDHFVVFYWMGFAGNETKTISLDLKAEVPGTYKGKASTVYLYYTPEHKYWVDGKVVKVE